MTVHVTLNTEVMAAVPSQVEEERNVRRIHTMLIIQHVSETIAQKQCLFSFMFSATFVI